MSKTYKLTLTEKQRDALARAITAYEWNYIDGPPVNIPDEWSGRAARAEYNEYARDENRTVRAINKIEEQLGFTFTPTLDYK